MNSLIRRDIADHPDLFWLQQPLSSEELRLAEAMWHAPSDLLEFWAEFGTGEMFESEVMLRPFAQSLSVEFITERERAKGKLSGLFAFHLGLFLSGFHSEGFYAYERDSDVLVARFDTLDQ